MISKDNVQVFGHVPKDVKRRMKRIIAAHEEWSESKMIRAGVLRILSELEGQSSPTHDKPRRKTNAA